jgi:hypothetical protein
MFTKDPRVGAPHPDPVTRVWHRRPPHGRPRITLRHIEIALGLLWLLDGGLQFQPFMFTAGFFDGILGMANMGLPGPVSTADFHIASLLSAHPAWWNAAFATLQIALGVGLLWRRTARAALAVSIIWALGVWVVGEGFGASFMGGTSLLTGAPGAALIYAVVAIVLFTACGWRGPGSLRLKGFAVASWAVIWVGAAMFELDAVNYAANVPGAQIVNGAHGLPGPITSLNRSIGRLLAGHGTAFAVGLGLVAAAVGLGALFSRTRRGALVAGVGLAFLVGVVGQDLGELLSGQATDPGSGPPLIILALAIWVVTRPGPAPGPHVSSETVASPNVRLPEPAF